MIKRTLARVQDPAYAALRIVSGALFLCHGLQKLFGLLGGQAIAFGAKPQLWIGGLIELVAGVAIAAGLFTRCAAFVASGTMAVAFFQFHFKGELADLHWLPIVNHGELAVVNCFVFFFIATRGAGMASIDRALKRDE